jgi:hypothetical protein
MSSETDTHDCGYRWAHEAPAPQLDGASLHNGGYEENTVSASRAHPTMILHAFPKVSQILSSLQRRGMVSGTSDTAAATATVTGMHHTDDCGDAYEHPAFGMIYPTEYLPDGKVTTGIVEAAKSDTVNGTGAGAGGGGMGDFDPLDFMDGAEGNSSFAMQALSDAYGTDAAWDDAEWDDEPGAMGQFAMSDDDLADDEDGGHAVRGLLSSDDEHDNGMDDWEHHNFGMGATVAGPSTGTDTGIDGFNGENNQGDDFAVPGFEFSVPSGNAVHAHEDLGQVLGPGPFAETSSGSVSRPLARRISSRRHVRASASRVAAEPSSGATVAITQNEEVQESGVTTSESQLQSMDTAPESDNDFFEFE